MIMRYPIDGKAEDTNWFQKSYTSVMEVAELNNIDCPDSVDRLYEDLYNVNLILDSYQWVDRVEFKSREDAVMFIMKWS